MASGQLNGEVAVVTGACRGIGLAITTCFLTEQAHVVAVDIEPVSEALQRLSIQYPGRLVHIRADVASEADVAAMIAQVVARFGTLDVLVNNAGIEFYKPVTTTSVQEWNRLMDVNLGGVFLCSKQAMPLLLKANGCIVNVASELDIVAERHVAAYCASKGAILSLTRAMPVDHAPEVRVNCLWPFVVGSRSRTIRFTMKRPGTDSLEHRRGLRHIESISHVI